MAGTYRISGNAIIDFWTSTPSLPANEENLVAWCLIPDGEELQFANYQQLCASTLRLGPPAVAAGHFYNPPPPPGTNQGQTSSSAPAFNASIGGGKEMSLSHVSLMLMTTDPLNRCHLFFHQERRIQFSDARPNSRPLLLSAAQLIFMTIEIR